MPNPIARILAIMLAPGYLFVLATPLTDGIDPPLAFAAVFLGAAAICILLVILSSKFVDAQPESRRFSIGTLMIVTAILAIYFAYLRALLALPASANFEFDIGLVFGIAMFIAATTAILMAFSDSVLAFAVQCLHRFREFKNSI